MATTHSGRAEALAYIDEGRAKALPYAPYAISRRELLALPLAGAVAALAACRAPYDRRAFAVPARSAVGLFPAADYRVDFADLIYRGLETLRVDVRGKRVLLKPNLVEYENGSCINTNPLVVAGAAIAMLRAGAASIAVGEGPGHRRDTEYLVVSSGLYDQLKELKIPFSDLDHDDVRPVTLKSHFTRLDRILLPASVLQADLVVSMAKLKTHHWAGMTCGMKNLFGVVPGAVYGWPKNFLHIHGIPESIVDLNATVRPGLTIVDAVVAMEGDGPIMGTPRALGFVAMGTDTVAVDSTCARVIGFEPRRLDYLAKASDFLGNLDGARIDQRGEPVARYATRFAVVERLRSLQSSEP
jgi:uncharacterized protein (DUF362 family)